MAAKKSTLKLIGAALAASMLVIGCGKKEEAPPPMAMPEVNDVNCQFDRIKALPPEIQTKFGSLCARRSTPVNSEKKSYQF